MALKPQDVLVALKLCLHDIPSSYALLAQSLGMSASETHACIRRLGESRLLMPGSKQVRRHLFLNFLIHGVPYAFPVQPQGVLRGLPTSWAAPAMKNRLALSESLPPVWPDPEGTVLGMAVTPLYSSVPGAARKDPELYDLLAFVDALRMGRARERAIAKEELTQRLIPHALA